VLEKTQPLAEWLKHVPAHPDSMVQIEVTLKLPIDDAMRLAHGAARNEVTIERAIEFLLLERNVDGAILDWSNDGFKDEAECEADRQDIKQAEWNGGVE